MAYSKWKTSAVAAGISFLAGFCGIWCIVTAMPLEAHLPGLLIGCALIAVVLSFFWNTRLWLVPLCLAALLIGYWWQEGTLRLSMESLIYQISILYDQGYGWGILQWTDRSFLSQDLTPALLLVALPVIAVVSLTITGGFGWLGAGVALVPLLSCVLLKDTVPSELSLAGLLLAVLLILMTDRVRRRSHFHANRLTLMLVLPLMLMLTVLFTLIPQDSYNMQHGAQKLEDFILALLDKTEAPSLVNLPALVPGDQDTTVELKDVGKRNPSRTTVMTVQAKESTTLYLRGCAYDVYDGTSWSCTPGWNSWSLYYNSNSTAVRYLTVRTSDVHSVLYFTYVPNDMDQKVMGGRLKNEDGLQTYTLTYRDPIVYEDSWDSKEEAVGGQQLEEYLQLPDSTRQRALKILTTRVGIPTETTNAGQVWKNAMYICDWVSQRAKYDLNTGKMPADADDFALWFLEQSDTGYCTHFASAAVVLLRAAGIPAQYVTGYLVQTKANRTVSVTAANAHAWVEVFINGVGWVVLEPTPSQPGTVGENTGTVTPPPQQETTPSTQPEDPTEPDETTPQTQPSQPDDPTQPVQTTAPAHETQVATTTGTSPTELVGIAGPSGTPGRRSFGIVLLVLLCVLAALLALIGQWRVRVWLRRRTLRTGSPNQQALSHWKQLERMARAAKLPPEDEPHRLAQKARFSQHTLTDGELGILSAALADMENQLRHKSLPRQLVYTLILALY